MVIMAAQAAEDGGVDPELHELRRSLMTQYPQIFALKIDRMREFEAEVCASVARRLQADAAKGSDELEPTEVTERARLIGLLSLTLARAAWVAWAEHPDTASLPDLLMRSYQRLRDVVGVPERV
jgi:hypothetical protein